MGTQPSETGRNDLSPRKRSNNKRAETGGAGWRDPHNFSGAESIWVGNIGVYEGLYYIESPRLPTVMNTATTPVKVYSTFFMGRQALAEAVAEEPNVKQGPIVDKLGRSSEYALCA